MSGHGWVTPLPGGAKARCGGPGICPKCSQEAQQVAARLSMPEPPPKPANPNLPAVWGLVISDMHARDMEGRKKYGTPLQPFNGRDALKDAYQELLDGAVYLRQLLFERDGR